MGSLSGADEPIGDDELGGLFRLLDGRRIALAVSGGVDSMALMHLVARWLATPSGHEWLSDHHRATLFGDPQPRRQPGLPRRRPRGLEPAQWLGGAKSAAELEVALKAAPVVVLTVDHGLREASAREAELVKSAALQLGFAHQTLVWRHDGDRSEQPCGAQAAGPPSSGIQEKARRARYGLMADCIEHETWTLSQAGELRSHPLSPGHAKRTIVTAHHRDDLVETFLMRLKRGSGIDGLSAIRSIETVRRSPSPDRPYPTEIDLCRPLLDIPRTRLLATARAWAIDWCEDPSNDIEEFERVRLRRDMTSLEALGYGQCALHLSVRRLQKAREIVERHQAERLARWMDSPSLVETNAGLFASIDPSGAGISWSELLSPAGGNDAEIMLRILRQLMQSFGGQPVPPGLSQIEALRCQLSRVSGAGGLPGSRFAQTLGGCRIDFWLPSRPAASGRIRVWRETGRKGLPEIVLEPGDGGWWDNRFAVSISAEAPHPVAVRALGMAGWAELKRRVPALASWRCIPPGAAATLPAIWDAERLVAVPYFETLPRSLAPWLRHKIEHDWESMSGLTGSLYRAAFSP
ncbi:MAG: tRNA lysidine(34) synthetase TilS [Hyphomicrobiaceae bacterium]|nr:tRNA lysidine(34) synthetase TilS [Hyphomicrobiaceae bacterium]